MALQDQGIVIVRRNMRVKDSELVKVNGGEVGATLLNYLGNVIKTIYDIGKDLGGAIRRIATGNVCPL